MGSPWGVSMAILIWEMISSSLTLLNLTLSIDPIYMGPYITLVFTTLPYLRYALYR